MGTCSTLKKNGNSTKSNKNKQKESNDNKFNNGPFAKLIIYIKKLM